MKRKRTLKQFFSVMRVVIAIRWHEQYWHRREGFGGVMDIIDWTKNYYDEEMAAELAEIMMRLEAGGEEQVDLVYEREIIYNYPTNEWLIIFTPKSSSKGKLIMGVRRDNGTMNRY